jgi:hypothetical protein
MYGVFGRESTKHTVIYSAYLRLWPTLSTHSTQKKLLPYPRQMSQLNVPGSRRAVAPISSYHAAAATAMQVHEVGAPTLTWSASAAQDRGRHVCVYVRIHKWEHPR